MNKIAAGVAIAGVSVFALAGTATASTYGDFLVQGNVAKSDCPVAGVYCNVYVTYAGKTTKAMPSKLGTINNCSWWGVPQGSYVSASYLSKLTGKYVAVLWSVPSSGKDGAINCH